MGALEQYDPNEGYEYENEDGEVQDNETSGGLVDTESRPSSPKAKTYNGLFLMHRHVRF